MASLNGTGGYAERAVSPVSKLIGIPDDLATRDAVALLADGRTALALISRAELRAGETVLIEVAGGGVGTLLVQIARNAGARTSPSPAIRASSPWPGTSAPTWPSTTGRTAGSGRSATRPANGLVFDGVGGDIGLAAFGLLGAGGRFCPFGMASGSFTPVTPEQARAWRVSIRSGAGGSPEELAARARTALAEAAAGRLRPVIGQEFGLEEAAAAHAAIEARETIGKTLLTVQG